MKPETRYFGGEAKKTRALSVRKIGRCLAIGQTGLVVCPAFKRAWLLAQIGVHTAHNSTHGTPFSQVKGFGRTTTSNVYYNIHIAFAFKTYCLEFVYPSNTVKYFSMYHQLKGRFSYTLFYVDIQIHDHDMSLTSPVT